MTALTARVRHADEGPDNAEQDLIDLPEPTIKVPQLTPDTEVTALGECGEMLTIFPSVKHPGYYHMEHYRDMNTDNAEVVYTRPPARFDTIPNLLGYVIEHVQKFRPITPWISAPARKTEGCNFANAAGKPGTVR